MINIQEVKTKLTDKLKSINANKIILFGSYAYGTPHKDSDLDICIVKDKISSKMKEKMQIRNILSDLDIPIDILLVDTHYYQTHSDKNWINTALYEVNTKGEVLYEKG